VAAAIIAVAVIPIPAAEFYKRGCPGIPGHLLCLEMTK